MQNKRDARGTRGLVFMGLSLPGMQHNYYRAGATMPGRQSMQTGKWTCGFFLAAAAVMAQTAPQNGKKLSARELFYAETAPAKPAAAAKPAPRPVPAKPAPVEQAARPATPPPAAPARTSGGASGAPARTTIVPVAYSPSTE